MLLNAKKSHAFDNIILVQACFYINGRKIGIFDETEISGSILLAVSSFLRFSSLRHVDSSPDDIAFDFIYKSMYSENWEVGVNNNFRDRYSIHDIFNIAIADQGYVLYLVTFPNKISRILVGERDGRYVESIDVCEKNINKLF